MKPPTLFTAVIVTEYGYGQTWHTPFQVIHLAGALAYGYITAGDWDVQPDALRSRSRPYRLVSCDIIRLEVTDG